MECSEALVTWYTRVLPPLQVDDVHGWFECLDWYREILCFRVACRGVYLGRARLAFMRVSFAEFHRHMHEVEEAFFSAQLATWHDEPANDSDW